jgi:hypothetical protein
MLGLFEIRNSKYLIPQTSSLYSFSFSYSFSFLIYRVDSMRGMPRINYK